MSQVPRCGVGQVVFYSDAGALHYGAASSGEAPSRFYVEMRRANLQYFRKHWQLEYWLSICDLGA